MKITNTFVGGKMNMDIDQRLLPKGQYFKAMNIEVINPESNGTGSDDYGDSGVLRNSIGNLIPVSGANLPLNVTNISGVPLVSPRCIGACINPQSNSIYWLITSTYEDLIVEYLDTPNVIPTGGTAGTAGAISYIARAVKGVGAVAGKYFNFNVNYPVTGINYFNGFLMWTDNLNPPRMINVNTFKAWTSATPPFAWNQDDINVIVKPPLTSPTIQLFNDGSAKNYIQDKFLYFSYRYKYTDGRWSSIAPFSKVAFVPSAYVYNLDTGINDGMQNKYNIVNITVATGDRQVTDIQLLFKDSSQPNIYIIETVNKAKPIVSTSAIPNNTTWTYIRFDNSKIYATLPSSQLTRLFDNVPIRALGQDIIGSRLIYGNYTQYYDMITVNKSKVIPNFSIIKQSSLVDDNKIEPSLKANRNYEFGIIYKDDYGRMSTVITSPTNTCHIYNYSQNGNNLKNYVHISIAHNPPYWSTKYNIAIKQNSTEYYNIYPISVVFDPNYFFTYYRINNADKNKISEGDFIIIKSDYNGITNSNKEYRVLEIQYKTFGQIVTGSIEGLYIKIAKVTTNTLAPTSVFSPQHTASTASPAFYTWANLPAGVLINASPIVYYPYNGVSSRLPVSLFSYTRVLYVPSDTRIFIEYAGIINGLHCLNYKNFSISGQNINASPLPFRNATNNLSINVNIKISSSSPVYGYITINSSAICNIGDSWRLNIYSNMGKTLGGNKINKLGVAFPVDTGVNGENIYPGAKINFGFIVDDSVVYVNYPIPYSYNIITSFTNKQSFISNDKYVDIQEWFWESGAYLSFNRLLSPATPNVNESYKSVFFRYGTSISFASTNLNNQITLAPQSSQGGHVYMVINSTIPDSAVTLSSIFNMRIYDVDDGSDPSSGLSIIYRKNILALETIPKITNNAVFHECTEDLSVYTDAFGRKKHKGTIQDQTNTLPAIVSTEQSNNISITTNHSFNCWAFPNGVESDRINDDFNAPTMEWSPRVSVPVEDYGQQIVSEGLTYSGVYKQDSNVNNLNQFNLSLGNFKYLDKSFGSVQKIKSRNTDLVVFQQDKVSKVLFGKNLLSDSTGGGQVASIPEVLGTQIAYQGEFGISNNPESFAQWDDNMFFTDSQRGAVLRLGNDGIFEISSNGMRSFFNTNFKSQPDTMKIGVFDPYYKRYILSETNFTKSQSLSSTTVINDPLDTIIGTVPLYDVPIIVPSSGGTLPL
jgi:hypothetical protein